jgi:hypothetical protein
VIGVITGAGQIATPGRADELLGSRAEMSAGKPRAVPSEAVSSSESGAFAADDERAAPAGSEEAGLSSLLRRGVKAAIARWAVRRRSPEIWPRPQDEAPHAWDGRRHFAEDYTLAAVQPGLAVVARVEWLPGRETHRVWLTLLTPTAVYALPGTGQALLRGGGDHWRVGGVEFDCVEPLRRWTLRYHGRLEVRDPGGQRRTVGEEVATDDVEVRLDLTFLSQLPAFVPGTDDDPELLSRQLGAAEWDARLLKELRLRGARSYVQVGEVHGAVTLGPARGGAGEGPRLIAFGGSGLRQHGWGVRDWGASDEAIHCFADLGAAARVWVQQARFPWLTLTGGFVQRAAGMVPIRDLGVRATRQPARAASHVGLHVDAAGGELQLETETLAQLGLDMDGRGRVELVLCRVRAAGADAVQGWGVIVQQQRTIPRAPVAGG